MQIFALFKNYAFNQNASWYVMHELHKNTNHWQQIDFPLGVRISLANFLQKLETGIPKGKRNHIAVKAGGEMGFLNNNSAQPKYTAEKNW